MLWRDFPCAPLIGHCAYLCSALRHFGFELEFGYVRESCLLGRATPWWCCVWRKQCPPLFAIHVSLPEHCQGIAEEDTATSPSHAATVIYQASVQGQRRDRLCLSLLRDSGSVGSRWAGYIAKSMWWHTSLTSLVQEATHGLASRLSLHTGWPEGSPQSGAEWEGRSREVGFPCPTTALFLGLLVRWGSTELFISIS